MAHGSLVDLVDHRTDARVFLLGDINADVTLTLAEHPRPGGDGVASSQRIGLGGSAANTAVMLARTGVRSSMLSALGEDAWASLAVEALAHEGVDVTHTVRVADEPTSLNVVGVTPDGERTMLAYRGASSRFGPDDVPAELARGDLLHVSGYAVLEDPQGQAAERAVELARAAGVPVSLDVPVDPARRAPDRIRALLSRTDLLVVGLPEAEELVGACDARTTARELLSLGVSTVALKRGREGTLITDGRGFFDLPGLPAVPVDTTGAGDSFCAGAIAGLLAGLPTEVVGAVGNLFGAAAVERFGAGRSLPNLDEIRELEERVRDVVTNGCVMGR